MRRLRLVRYLALAWVASYTGLVYAFTAFSRDVRGYDYESLAWAAAVGLAGGIAQTILWLADENSVVLRFWRQLLRDVVFSLIGGAVVYVVVNLLASYWPEYFGKELRMAAVFFAGFSKGRWRDWLTDLGAAGLARARATITGSPPQKRQEPTTITMPLTDK